MTERRRFIVRAGGLVAATAGVAIINAPTSSLNRRSSGGCPQPGSRRSTYFKAQPNG